jgi:hypothetical protein
MMTGAFDVDVDFNGIVVFAWPDLARFFGGRIEPGRNILREFTETDLGDDVVDAGTVVPVINLDDGRYRVRFFDAAVEPSPRRRVAFSDAGFVLNVTERLYVADAAVFRDWEERLAWTPVDVAAGTYAVTVEGVQHLDATGRVEMTGYDLVLQRTDRLARRCARLREDSRVPWR